MKQTSLVNTDKAWENLYNRLEQENLISKASQKHRLYFWDLVGAAVILFCIFIGTGIYMLSDRSKGALLSMTNEDVTSSLVATFEDGSTAYLSENTSIYYPEHFLGNERRIKVDGDALFDINREPERPFFIETEHVLVKVLGTAFRVNTNNKNTAFELSVKKGLVEVCDKSWGKTVLVAAGESVSLVNGQLLKGHLNTDQFSKFTSKLRFKDESLENMVKVIMQTTDSDIVIDSDELKNLKLNASFRDNSADTMVKIICIGLNLNYKVKDDVFHIYKP